jgi:hypothetical protein
MLVSRLHRLERHASKFKLLKPDLALAPYLLVGRFPKFQAGRWWEIVP